MISLGDLGFSILIFEISAEKFNKSPFILSAASNEFENSLDISYPFRKSETGIWDIVDTHLQSSVLLVGSLIWMKVAHNSYKYNFRLGKYTGIFGSVIWLTGTIITAYVPTAHSKKTQ
jgi:hypothetical protein